MATFGRYNVGFNRGANAGAVLMNIVMLIIWLSVGDTIINSLRGGIMNLGNTAQACGATGTNAGAFCSTYTFLGIRTVGSTGIVSIIGILLGVAVLIQVFRVTRTG